MLDHSAWIGDTYKIILPGMVMPEKLFMNHSAWNGDPCYIILPGMVMPVRSFGLEW